MQLFTKEQEERLIKNHQYNDEHRGTDKEKSFSAVVKLFNPVGIGTWYLSELDPETNIAFGLCDLGFPELGSVSVAELQEVRGWGGLGIERDKFFTPTKMSELRT